MRTVITSLVGLVVFVVAVWAIGEAVGFEISLWGTLALSLVATLLLNLMLGGVRRVRA